jgi:cell division septation protein DedD
VLVQAEKLERLFQEAVIVNINELEGKTVYKVVVGAFPTDAPARELLKKMKEKGIDGFVRNLETLQ